MYGRANPTRTCISQLQISFFLIDDLRDTIHETR